MQYFSPYCQLLKEIEITRQHLEKAIKNDDTSEIKVIIDKLKNNKEILKKIREKKEQIKYVNIIDDEIQRGENHWEYLKDKQLCLDAISHHITYQEWGGKEVK